MVSISNRLGKCNDELKQLHSGKFDFDRILDLPDQKFRMRLYTCISEMNLGAFIGEGSLHRANMVLVVWF